MNAAPSDTENWDDRAMQRTRAAAENVAATLRIASAFAGSGRRIDLAGLDNEVGKLCAGVLDLPPPLGLAMRPCLVSLLAELDHLAATVQPP
jgi:hypothetical protein